MSKVSRSVYQKATEENKRLISDIQILVASGVSLVKIRCIQKWRKKFKDDDDFGWLMKEAARQYLKDNPDELPDFLVKPNNDKD